MSTTYGVTRSFMGATYSCSGFASHEEALFNVHELAFENGDWRPRPLRERWWQFWRPIEHTDIEKKFAGLEPTHGN